MLKRDEKKEPDRNRIAESAKSFENAGDSKVFLKRVFRRAKLFTLSLLLSSYFTAGDRIKNTLMKQSLFYRSINRG